MPMSRKPPSTKDPSLVQRLREAVTVVRATPYDLVILWTEEGVSEADHGEVYELADALSQSTGAILAVLPRKVVGDVTSHSLMGALTLRAQMEKIMTELDEVIAAMTAEQAQGDA